MNSRLTHRLVSLVMAAAVTLGMLGGVDHLASSEPASPQWAAASVAPRV